MGHSLLSLIARGIANGGDLVISSALDRRATPEVISPLPAEHRHGLIAVGVTSALSVITTASLFLMITYRLVFWRKYFRTYIGYNQYIILIYNLLLADLQEAMGFLLSLYWVDKDKLYNHSGFCFAQGWLLQIGDPSSGLFVLAIAIHTFVTVLLGRKIEHRTFVGWVVGLWAFCLCLVVIPTARHGNKTFGPTGAWCWIKESYVQERLWLHYLWIFISEFGSIVLYLILFLYLRRRVAASAALSPGQTEHLTRLRRVTGYMVLYPLAYTVLSLPLAAGRMSAASGRNMGIGYFCAAGAMIALSGFVDVIMYALTRRALLVDSQDSYHERTNASDNKRSRNHITTITADPIMTKSNHMRKIYGQSTVDRDSTETGTSSTDNIMKDVELAEMGKVYQKTTIEVSHELASGRDISTSSSATSPGGKPQSTWFGK